MESRYAQLLLTLINKTIFLIVLFKSQASDDTKRAAETTIYAELSESYNGIIKAFGSFWLLIATF